MPYSDLTRLLLILFGPSDIPPVIWYMLPLWYTQLGADTLIPVHRHLYADIRIRKSNFKDSFPEIVLEILLLAIGGYIFDSNINIYIYWKIIIRLRTASFKITYATMRINFICHTCRREDVMSKDAFTNHDQL